MTKRTRNSLLNWVDVYKRQCQGSGANPYQTQVDLQNIAFKCSCPSHKFPCKHSLGLLFLYASQPNLFSTGEEPAWVSEWLDKRANKAGEKKEKSDKPVDAAAQAKRCLLYTSGRFQLVGI